MRFLTSLHSFSGQLYNSSLQGEEYAMYEAYYERVLDRNAKVLGMK
jgi:octanoyl-[GcvH]:protein N-octanoyltransferase